MEVIPRWNETLEELAAAAATANKNPLWVCIIPQDAPTYWNKTYKMFKFAYLYRKAIDNCKITGDHSMQLSECQLSESEWDIVRELQDTLVSAHIHLFKLLLY
jgi:hypothetical protein